MLFYLVRTICTNYNYVPSSSAQRYESKFYARRTSEIVMYEFEQGAQFYRVECSMLFCRMPIAFRRILASPRISVRDTVQKGCPESLRTLKRGLTMRNT